jgi:ABC-type antimicrobial peptide transport system permease subunit
VTFLAFGRTLKNVVQTKGNDIALMMGALKSLGAAFVIQIVAASAGFAIGVVASAIGIAK